MNAYQLERDQMFREVEAFGKTLDHYNGPAQQEVRVLLNDSQRSYEEGQISWLELRQALEQAVRFKINRLDALLRYNDAVIELEMLTKDQQ